MVRLGTRKTSSGIVYTVGRVRRIVFAAVLAFLLWGIILNLSEGDSPRTMVAPIVMACIALLGLTYREAWRFLPSQEKVESLFGFGPFVKRETIPYGEIERLEITHFVKDTEDKNAKPGRKRQKPMVVFAIRLANNEERTIEIIPEHTSLGRTESAAQMIAAVSGLALFVDRPRDMDTTITREDLHSFR